MASSSQIPFGPGGPTITFTAVTPTPPTAQQALIDLTTATPAGQFRIINSGNVLVFLGVGGTATVAATNAGAIATSIPILPGTDEVLRFAPESFFTGKAISGSAVVYITPGQGL
jgi:hypothetical protein